MVGWVLGLTSSIFVDWFREVRENRVIRMMLYREMVNNYCELKRLRQRIMDSPPSQRLIEDEPKEVMMFGAYDGCCACLPALLCATTPTRAPPLRWP